MLTHAFVKFIVYSSHFTSLSVRLECTFSVRSNILLKNDESVYCPQDPQVLFLAKTTSKLDSTALFTHLKIILLQYFQFSVFSLFFLLYIVS